MTMEAKAKMQARNQPNSEQVADLLREFRVTYADATSPDESEAARRGALLKRRMEWRAERQISLSQAKRCYAQIHYSYNEFRPAMIAALCRAFSGDGITVTAAREFSVAIYLHVPDQRGLRTRVEDFVRSVLQADAVAWTEPGTLRVWWD